MRLFALLLWVAVPVAAYASSDAIGRPYMLWSYTFSSSGSQYELAGRIYRTCTYVGWGYDQITVPATNGRCPLVHYVPADDD